MQHKIDTDGRGFNHIEGVNYRIICKWCKKLAIQDGEFLNSCGSFCSVDCAQHDCDSQLIEEELQSETPNLEGLYDALPF